MDADSADNIYVVGRSDANIENNSSTGTIAGAYYLIKFNSSGDIVWKRSRFGGMDPHVCKVMVDEGQHGGVFVTGKYFYSGKFDGFLEMFDFNGTYKDQELFGTSGEETPLEMTSGFSVITVAGRTTNTFVGNKPGSDDIFLYTFMKTQNYIYKQKVLEFGGSQGDFVSSIHISGGTDVSGNSWFTTNDLIQSGNSHFRVQKYNYPSLYVTGYLSEEIEDTFRTDSESGTITKLNSYTRVGEDRFDSYIAKFSYLSEAPDANYRMDWFKYLHFGGTDTHNYFDINNAGELIMGITIDNSTTVDTGVYIIKAYDNGTIVD